MGIEEMLEMVSERGGNRESVEGACYILALNGIAGTVKEESGVFRVMVRREDFLRAEEILDPD